MSTAFEILSAHFPYVLEHFAVAVAAVSGVLAGRGKNVDLFGVLVLALVTAFGGGTLRDIMVGDTPVTWIRDATFVTTATAAAVTTFVSARFFETPRRLLLIADAIALALMTLIGAKKALGFQVAPSIAVTMGVITGVAGGIVRDILTGEVPLVFRPQIYLYATAAIVGAGVYVAMIKAGVFPQAALLTGMVITLVLRLAAIRWRLRLPTFVARQEHSPSEGSLIPCKSGDPLQ